MGFWGFSRAQTQPPKTPENLLKPLKHPKTPQIPKNPKLKPETRNINFPKPPKALPAAMEGVPVTCLLRVQSELEAPGGGGAVGAVVWGVDLGRV